MVMRGAVEQGQLDPAIAAAFFQVLDRSGIAYQRGRLHDFEVQAAQHEALGQAEVRGLRELGDGVERTDPGDPGATTAAA